MLESVRLLSNSCKTSGSTVEISADISACLLTVICNEVSGPSILLSLRRQQIIQRQRIQLLVLTALQRMDRLVSVLEKEYETK